ncbi:hypothetical protein BC938DRAFT_472074 [Jimgerdemannia flammicorona]|uniref:Uncharacterized protein n=1 Tax=Jimgerdemannia flammicorona TaxID=994334 RepID=A0A433QUC3_9FUNG|nr:hypothetical protein BC938DRAFT_472074 [Jimgerdemannia flammicorona]
MPRLWHVSRKECLCVFPHLDFVTAIAFHPRDDRFFLSGSLDCKLRLWNIPEKKVAFWNEVPDDNLITAVGFTLDGKIACAGSYVGLCLFYETDGLRYNTQISVKDQKGRNSKKGRKITGIEPVPNMPPGEEKLLITSNDSRIRLVNMRDKSWECKYKGLENTSSQIKATFSDDGKYIICGSEDHSVYIWNTEQPGFVLPFHNDAHPQPTQTASAGLLTKSLGTALGALGEQALHAAVTPAGVPGNTTSRVGGWFKKREATIAVPAPIREKLKGSFESFEAHNQIVTCAIFAPTKTKLLLAADGNDSIYANTPVPSVASAPTSPSTPLPDPAYIPVNNNTAAYTYPDGDIIVTADYTGCIKVWRHDCASYIPPQMTGSSLPQSTLSASTAAIVLNDNNSNGSLDAIAQPTQTLSATLATGDEHTPAKTRVGLGSIFYGRRKVDRPTKIADDHSAPPSPTTTGPAMTCSGCGGKEFKSFVAVPQTGGESGDVGESTPRMEMQVCVGCNRVVARL